MCEYGQFVGGQLGLIAYVHERWLFQLGPVLHLNHHFSSALPAIGYINMKFSYNDLFGIRYFKWDEC